MKNFREYKSNPDTNECTSRGICSLSPTIAAMREILVMLLEHIAYYVLKLEKLGGNNKNLLIDLINDVASLNSINAVNDTRLYDILMRNYMLLIEVESTYIKHCRDNNIEYITLKLPIEFSKDLPFSKVISLGEKLFLINYKKLTQNQKNYIDILFVITKSVCQNLSRLNDFNTYFKEGYNLVLESLNSLNNPKCKDYDIKKNIEKLAKLDHKLTKALATNLFNDFGKISKVNVSHSTRPGKAILVSGNSFSDLHNILEETKGKDIDIYTHSDLQIAHALDKFRQYKNLIGHYGNNTESCILDYGTFPGAILLTKGERNKSEYLYRGRLFSNDFFANAGVIKIKDNDFEPVIDAAGTAKGFSTGKEKESSVIGYDEEKILAAFDEINTKLKNGEIKHLYIIGLNSYSERQKEYFKNFFQSMNPDEYAVSFFYKSPRKNVLTINIGNYAPLAAMLLGKLFGKDAINPNVTFIYTTCEAMTISGIITLKLRGANSIYMADCPPMMLNPSVFGTFLKNYDIKVTTNASEDLFDMRQI